MRRSSTEQEYDMHHVYVLTISASYLQYTSRMLAHPCASLCFASKIASSLATIAALLTLPSINARFAGILAPLLSSRILDRINGVLALPEMPAASACRIASAT
jgi:hypothetical protein